MSTFFNHASFLTYGYKMRAISQNEVFGAINVSFALISLGFVQGFGTISLASTGLNEEQGSWFVSIDMLMAIIFPFIGGKITEVFGIKMTFLISSPIVVLGWILVGTFVSTFWLIFGRALSGIGVAVMMVSPSVYIAETAYPDGRATLSSIVGFSFSFGVCTLWFLGYFFEWQTIAFLATVPAILSFVGFLFLPDTPYWLIQNQRFEEAHASLKYFRRHDEDEEVINEFNEILQHYHHKKALSQVEKLKSLFSFAFIKPFTCIGILYPLYEFSGTIITTNYLQSIIIESKFELEPPTCSLILGFVRIFSSVMTLLTIQNLQPKLTYVAFAIIKTVSLLIIGAYFLLQVDHPDISIWTGIPFTMIILLYISHTFLCPVNWMLIGEMFPSELRNFAAGFIESVAYTASFVVLKLYIQMKHSLGLHGVFFFNASFAALCAIYASLTVPDNRGKSLSEIEKNNNFKTPLIPKE